MLLALLCHIETIGHAVGTDNQGGLRGSKRDTVSNMLDAADVQLQNSIEALSVLGNGNIIMLVLAHVYGDARLCRSTNRKCYTMTRKRSSAIRKCFVTTRKRGSAIRKCFATTRKRSSAIRKSIFTILKSYPAGKLHIKINLPQGNQGRRVHRLQSNIRALKHSPVLL